MQGFFRQPFLDVLAALEQLAVGPADAACNAALGPKPSSVKPPTRPTPRGSARVLATPFITLVVTWFIYVPIHELLHVLGCVATGGTVTRLELSARYGAAILSKVFPFVVSGSDYAGQLKGFDTKGSDLCYLATDFLPFVLSILIGVPLIKIAGRRRRPVMFGIAIVLGLAPFYNLSGDYFEMASIISTRGVAVASGTPTPAPPEPAADDRAAPWYYKLRSDDVFRLLSNFTNNPGQIGATTLGSKFVAIALILVSCVLAILLSFGTYWAGHLFSQILGLDANPAASVSRQAAI